MQLNVSKNGKFHMEEETSFGKPQPGILDASRQPFEDLVLGAFTEMGTS